MSFVKNYSDNDMLSLLSVLQTLHNVNKFYVDIADYIDTLYKTKDRQDLVLQDKADHINSTYDSILTKLTNCSTPDDISGALTSIVAYIREVPVITYTMSFTPTAKFLRNLYLTTQRKLNTPSVLDIRIDPSIIGGIRYDFFGNYGDLSLISRLDTYFIQNKDAILSNIQK